MRAGGAAGLGTAGAGEWVRWMYNAHQGPEVPVYPWGTRVLTESCLTTGSSDYRFLCCRRT